MENYFASQFSIIADSAINFVLLILPHAIIIFGLWFLFEVGLMAFKYVILDQGFRYQSHGDLMYYEATDYSDLYEDYEVTEEEDLEGWMFDYEDLE